MACGNGRQEGGGIAAAAAGPVAAVQVAAATPAPPPPGSSPGPAIRTRLQHRLRIPLRRCFEDMFQEAQLFF